MSIPIKIFTLLRGSPTYMMEGKPELIQSGENNGVDVFLRKILHIPEKTNVFHYNTRKILQPLDLIGGKEIRYIGDTCRMFFKVKHVGRTADYYFWDGIFTSELSELYAGIMHDFYYFQNSDDFKLVTGSANHRMVLMEKVNNSSPRKL